MVNQEAAGRDVVHTAFLRASKDGFALASEAEWRSFVGQLKAGGVCGNNDERKVLEEAWATCDTAVSAKRLTYAAFRNHVVGAFLRSDDGSESARRRVRTTRAYSAQLQALCGVGGAPLERCRELLERCNAADEALLGGEKLLAASLRAAERRLEAERLRGLVRDTGPPRKPDPVRWQREHCVDVEKRSAAWRVSAHEHVRYPKGGGRVDDAWGLAGGDSPDVAVRAARVLCSDGATREAFVVAIAPADAAQRGARRHATSRTAAWRVFAAHRELNACCCAPRAYGWIDEQPGADKRRRAAADEPRGCLLVYERPRGAAKLTPELRRLYDGRRRVPLTARSPLVRHWLREALERFAEIDECAAHDLEYASGPPLSAENLWIAEHGAALRLGAVPWGKQMAAFDDGTAVARRSRSLLSAFAGAADAILDGLCGGRDAPTGDDPARPPSRAPPKVYGEKDARAGAYVSPGERFDVLLDAPSRGSGSHTWRVPDLDDAQLAVVDLLDAAPGAPLPRDAASGKQRLRGVGSASGTARFAVVAVADDGHRTDALTLTVSVADGGVPGDLAAILSVCRADAAPRGEGAAREPVPCTARALLGHAYFAPLATEEIADAMESYNRLFLAVDDESDAGPTPPRPPRMRHPETGGRRLNGDD